MREVRSATSLIITKKNNELILSFNRLFKFSQYDSKIIFSLLLLLNVLFNRKTFINRRDREYLNYSLHAQIKL